jgi:hypothetical protein
MSALANPETCSDTTHVVCPSFLLYHSRHISPKSTCNTRPAAKFTKSRLFHSMCAKQGQPDIVPPKKHQGLCDVQVTECMGYMRPCRLCCKRFKVDDDMESVSTSVRTCIKQPFPLLPVIIFSTPEKLKHQNRNSKTKWLLLLFQKN